MKSRIKSYVKNKIVSFIFAFMCLVCFFAYEYAKGQDLNMLSITFDYQVKPFVLSMLNFDYKNQYPEKSEETEIYLKTENDGTFSFGERNSIVVPGTGCSAVLDSGMHNLEDYCIDFNQNAAWIKVDGREYVLANIKTPFEAKEKKSSIWKDSKTGNVKLGAAVPLSKTEILVMQTDISDEKGNKELIEHVSDYLDKVLKEVSVSESLSVSVNEISLNSEEIAVVSPAAVMLKDNSSLMTIPYDKSQYINLRNIYTKDVFNSWQPAPGNAEENSEIKQYVRIQDDVQYVLVSQENDFELDENMFAFPEPSEEDIAEETLYPIITETNSLSSAYASSDLGTMYFGNTSVHLYFSDSQATVDAHNSAGVLTGLFGSVPVGVPGCSLIGDHNYQTGKYLGGLNVGDYIYVDTSYGQFLYQVTRKTTATVTASPNPIYTRDFLLHDNNTYFIEGACNGRFSGLALYTCYPFDAVTTNQRYIVFAKLVNGTQLS